MRTYARLAPAAATTRMSTTRSSLRVSREQVIPITSATRPQQTEEVIPIEVNRTKPLAQLTAEDIPRGLHVEDLATDAEGISKA